MSYADAYEILSRMGGPKGNNLWISEGIVI